MPRWSRIANRSHKYAARFVAIATLMTLGLGTPAATQGGRAEDFRDHWGPRFTAAGSSKKVATLRADDDVVRRWNEVTLDANALDHTPLTLAEDRVFGHQLGPGRTARAFAIVHIAMFDAYNAIVGGFRGYTNLPAEPRVRGSESATIDAAVATAAHDALVALYPSHAPTFAEQLAEDLSRIPDGRAESAGIDLGQRAAAAILTSRAGDGSDIADPLVADYMLSDQPGFWRPDPISQVPVAVGAYWGGVTPFVLQSLHQFPNSPPPSLESHEYADAFNEVKSLGGDGVVTRTARTAEQTIAGIFWAYDGTPGLGTPPRLYNQVVREIADARSTNAFELARLLALVNVAMADVAIACWESKFRHQVWRPITGIREADPGTGPTGLGDNNPRTIGDPTFTPLGAPASNFLGPNFTPPFPAFESGHSAIGSALFQTLRNFYRTDRIAFTFVSDEFNGVTKDNTGVVRPRVPRRFPSLSAAEEENGQSRIYLGIHWAFDKTQGRVQGRKVADYVFETVLLPERR